MRLLIVTGAALADPNELPTSIRALIEQSSEVLVVTPALPRRLEWLVSDVDEARHNADERLNTVLGQLESMDVPAAGQVGDDSPLTAIEDAVREFAPDHILIGLRSSDHADWQEPTLLDQVVRRFHLPMTVFEIDSSGHVPRPGQL